jgi:cytochrome P450
MRDPITFTVDNPRFSTSRVVGPSMLSLDGADHARHREPFAHPFRPARVRDRFTGFIEAETDRLISVMRPAGRAELRPGARRSARRRGSRRRARAA